MSLAVFLPLLQVIMITLPIEAHAKKLAHLRLQRGEAVGVVGGEQLVGSCFHGKKKKKSIKHFKSTSFI